MFDQVSFAYPGAARPALADVSFIATSGHTVSLVGASGAGKTTLMHLLPRFYDVSSGAIRVDGVDLREMDLKSLRTAIGVVSQDIFLFNATIRENIGVYLQTPKGTGNGCRRARYTTIRRPEATYRHCAHATKRLAVVDF